MKKIREKLQELAMVPPEKAHIDSVNISMFSVSFLLKKKKAWFRKKYISIKVSSVD